MTLDFVAKGSIQFFSLFVFRLYAGFSGHSDLFVHWVGLFPALSTPVSLQLHMWLIEKLQYNLI